MLKHAYEPFRLRRGAALVAFLNRLAEKREIEKDELVTTNGKKVLVYTGPNVTKVQKKLTFDAIRHGD